MSGSCPVSALVCRETARERDELRTEVERLRAGIEALIVEYGDERDLMDPDYYYARSIASSDLAALLNPTEGETDG